MEEQATNKATTTAMSAIPPLESSSMIEDDDDNFGTFSGFETAASSDDDGSPDEYLQEDAPADASPPLSAMVPSSSLNEDEFFDAPFEAAGINQINDPANENVENGVAAEKMNQPGVEDAAIIPPNDLAAVESKGGEINDNHVADSTDLFSAFDGIAESGGEQNEVSHFKQQDDIGFGEFEGTLSGSSNDIADIFPSNGDDDDSPSDAPGPEAAELGNGESISPEYDENSAPAKHYTKETHSTASLEGGVTAFESHAASELDEIAESGQYQGASHTTPTPADTSSAFDAFAEIQDAPLPPFASASHAIEGEGYALTSADAVIGTTMDDSGDNFGEFAGVDSLEKAADEKTQNYSTKEGDVTKERETVIEKQVTAPVPETSVSEAAPTNVTTRDAAEEDSGDVFGAFEETSPASGAFGAFSSPTHDNMDTAHAEKEQDIPMQDDAALVIEATAFDEVATGEVDDFGDFTAPNDGDLPLEMDTAFADVEAALVEAAVEKSDDFGDFTAPENNSAEKDAALDEGAIRESDLHDFGGFAAPPVFEEENVVEEGLPVEQEVGVAEQDTTLPEEGDEKVKDLEQNLEDETALREATEKGSAFDGTATEELDDFGDFTAPNEDLPVEMDTAFAEVDTGTLAETAVEESNDFGDFTAPEINAEKDAALDEGAAAPPVSGDETLVEGDLPVEEEVGVAEQDTTLPEGKIDDNDDFGDFTTHVNEAPPDELHLALPEDNIASSETVAEEFGDFGDFSAPVEAETDLEIAPVASNEVQSDNFGTSTAPEEEVSSPNETTTNEDDDFGNFGGFSSPAIEGGAATTASAEGADDDFGNFGDFSAPIKAETENNHEERPAEKPAENHIPVDAQSAAEEEEDFGEFGDFAAFGDEAAPTDNEQNAQVDEKAAEDIPTSKQAPPSQAVSAEEDEFGDFGDFKESEEVKEISVENEPSRPVHVLNENVRAMFQKVFRVDNPAESENGDCCVQLPFDVPMRTVLAPRKSNAEEKGDKKIYKSDKEIKEITEYIESLPTSPPSIILSEEKWYPYTQYVFHRDGTPYIEKAANLMGVAAPSVPEVLNVELPTGFDASTFSPTISSSPNTRCTTPPAQFARPTATLVDFPSADTKMSSPSADTNMTEEDAKEAAEDDEFGKLSAAGKKFMDKLPDLSYMLQPTLSTAN